MPPSPRPCRGALDGCPRLVAGAEDWCCILCQHTVVGKWHTPDCGLTDGPPASRRSPLASPAVPGQ
jgi:hypothetical protein